MNIKCLRLFVTGVALLMLAPPSFAKSTVKQPKTVYDYFMLLPQRFFEIEGKENRAKWFRETKEQGSFFDTKNDYLFMRGDGAQGSIYVALFRYHGQVLVAVRNSFEEGNLTFLRRNNSVWKDVTKQTMPIPYNASNTYIIPRFGTTIKIFSGNNFNNTKVPSKHLYDFVWMDGKFKLRKPVQM